MREINAIEFYAGSREEQLPGFAPDFPYLASRAHLGQYAQHLVPWHWHSAVELFYMESGQLEYLTPSGRMVFPQGSGGFVNSNVLHMTRPLPGREETIQLLHIFSPALLAGQMGSRIEQRYIAPLSTATQVELLPLFPHQEEHRPILHQLRLSFDLSEETPGYELLVREQLSQLWLRLLKLAAPQLAAPGHRDKASEEIKAMMAYIHEHYPEKLTVAQIAAAAYVSSRECFRAFRSCLHTTPTDYLTQYRLQAACRMLVLGDENITLIGQSCGLGNSSYFGRVFRLRFGCTPLEYRRRWQKTGAD